MVQSGEMDGARDGQIGHLEEVVGGLLGASGLGMLREGS